MNLTLSARCSRDCHLRMVDSPLRLQSCNGHDAKSHSVHDSRYEDPAIASFWFHSIGFLARYATSTFTAATSFQQIDLGNIHVGCRAILSVKLALHEADSSSI